MKEITKEMPRANDPDGANPEGEAQVTDDLIDALLLCKNRHEMSAFIKDLCTPQERRVLQERWRSCQLLSSGMLSYRQIHGQTGASLTTIGRVARFLNEEPHHGYRTVLEKQGRLSVEKKAAGAIKNSVKKEQGS